MRYDPPPEVETTHLKIKTELAEWVMETTDRLIETNLHRLVGEEIDINNLSIAGRLSVDKWPNRIDYKLDNETFLRVHDPEFDWGNNDDLIRELAVSMQYQILM